MRLMLVLPIFLFSLLAHAGTDKANCTLTLTTSTTRLIQEPLKSEKRITMTSANGLSSARHRFDLIGTNFDCEVAFSGFDTGTFINCWKKDMSMGVQADRSTIKNKDEHKTQNVLAVSGPGGQTKIIFKCDR